MGDNGSKRDKNDHAVALSDLGASKGGIARAEKLSADERSKIARKAARARWMSNDKPIQAIYAGTLKIGDAEIPCANLPDGRRVLSESAIMSTLGRGYSGYYSERDSASGMPAVHRSVSPAVLRPFIAPELRDMLEKPIAYTPPGGRGLSKGVPAEALQLICETWIKARDKGVLTERQMVTAAKAEILYRGFVVVGINALVDEATGAQYARGREALAEILEQFISKELAAWEKTFSDEFYRELFRVRGWNPSEFRNRPGIVGKYTTDIVYRRLAPGVLQRLQEIIPRDSRGRLKFRLHQGLTRDRGYLALREHLASVTTILRLTDDGQWERFMTSLDRVHTAYGETLMLPFMALDADNGGKEPTRS